MSEFIVKVIEAEYLAVDVKRFVVTRPPGYTFIPGQATDVAIRLPGWETKKRAFTFSGFTDADSLEFIVKIYNDHKGVTNRLSSVNEGAELIIHDVYGAIQYSGPGVYFAGGSGITPFVAILRDLWSRKLIAGNKLINSNKTSADIILGEEMQYMLGDNFVNVLTRENNIGFMGRRIGRDFIIEQVRDFNQRFYVCGPEQFVHDISQILLDLGADSEKLVIEK